MMERKIVARVRKDGTTKLDVAAGPGGAGCLDMLAPFERALGGDVERTEKAEMSHPGLSHVCLS